MTKEQLAAQLNGREYPLRLSAKDQLQARNNGLVIVYGASDDLCEFDGAISDECGAPGDIFVTRAGVLELHDDCDCKFCGYKTAVARATKIEAFWCVEREGPEWTYQTAIPHATFSIMEDGRVFCRGIVFSVEDLSQ